MGGLRKKREMADRWGAVRPHISRQASTIRISPGHVAHHGSTHWRGIRRGGGDNERQQPAEHSRHRRQGPRQPIEAPSLARCHRQEGAQRQAIQSEGRQSAEIVHQLSPNTSPDTRASMAHSETAKLTAISTRGRRASRNTTSGQKK